MLPFNLNSDLETAMHVPCQAPCESNQHKITILWFVIIQHACSGLLGPDQTECYRQLQLECEPTAKHLKYIQDNKVYVFTCPHAGKAVIKNSPSSEVYNLDLSSLEHRNNSTRYSPLFSHSIHQYIATVHVNCC